MSSRVISSVPAGESIPRCGVRCLQRKEKAEIRPGFLRKLKREATRFVRKRSGLTRKKPLKKIARSRRRELAEYFALTTKFLLRPENALCLICTVRREHGENILVQVATEVHHYAGRIGRLLCYIPFFKPSCRSCRDWPHQNPIKAREWGLLAPPARWNVFPRS
jgi:hypothetical protein